MVLTYNIKNSLYLNITNHCTNRCDFCIRDHGTGLYASLKLEREPALDEILGDVLSQNLHKYKEIVFCGYGEPAERLPELLEVAAWLKQNYTIPVRINTNGLADLIWGRSTAPELAGKIDCVSISLNATDAEEYLRLTRSKFGIGSFDAMLKFAKDCAQYVPHVVMTVVDQVTTPEEQEKARQICAGVGATLRIRPLES